MQINKLIKRARLKINQAVMSLNSEITFVTLISQK